MVDRKYRGPQGSKTFIQAIRLVQPYKATIGIAIAVIWLEKKMGLKKMSSAETKMARTINSTGFVLVGINPLTKSRTRNLIVNYTLYKYIWIRLT